MTRRSGPDVALIALAWLGFIAIGLPDGLLGVAWPSIRGEFGLDLRALGPLLAAYTGGYLASSFSSGALIARMAVGGLLALSCAITAAALAGYALAPSWSLLVAGALVAGLGAGAIDAGINSFAAQAFSTRGVNWLHAFYGVGAASGPLLMTAVLMAPLSWRWGYAVVAAGQFLLALAFALSRRRWPLAPGAQADALPRVSLRDTLRQPGTRYGIAVFFVYTGTEAAAGVWAYSLLHEARGLAMDEAGRWVSVYWGSLTLGRLLIGGLAGALRPDALLRWCLCGLIAGATLLWLDPPALPGTFGLAVMGLSAAAVFPTLIASSPHRLGAIHADNAIGMQIAAAALGQATLPALIGVLADRAGLEVAAPTLFAAALCALLLFLRLARLNPLPTPSRPVVPQVSSP